METRKLIMAGNSSLSVALPIKWIRENKLSKGDNIFLEINPDQITISKFTRKPEKEVYSIMLTEQTDPYIEQILYSAFLSTKNEIEIENCDTKMYYVISEIVDKLPFMKVEEKTKNQLKISIAFDKESLDLNVEMKRVIFFFTNIFNLINDPEYNEIFLNQAYAQTSSQLLIIMKLLKMNYMSLDKIQALKYRQQIDSYYFLLKSCKDFIMLTNPLSNTDKKIHKFITEIKEYLKNISNFEHKRDMLESLKAYDLFIQRREEILQCITHNQNNTQQRKYIIINNMYEAILSLLYANINNME
jgi:hypothetical protein